MQNARTDLRAGGDSSRRSPRTGRGKGEDKKALLGAFLVMFLLVGLVGWADCSPKVAGTQKWAYTTGGEVNSSPAIAADGTIYVGSENLYAIYGTSKLASTPWPMFHHDLKHTGRIR